MVSNFFQIEKRRERPYSKFKSIGRPEKIKRGRKIEIGWRRKINERTKKLKFLVKTLKIRRSFG